jgi:hypothetical protein
MAGPGPLGPVSWAARAQAMGMGRAMPAVAPAAQDGEDEIDQLMREEREQDKRDRLRDMIEEAADRREIRKLERQQRLTRLRAQANGEMPEGRGGGRSDDDDGLELLRRDLITDRNDMKNQIDSLRGLITKSTEDTLKSELGRLSTEIANIRSAPGIDPMEQLTKAFEMAATVRSRVDSLMPAPPPPPIDPGLTHEQTLARERALLEHDIYRLEREEALESVKLKRDEIRNEREQKQERLAGIVDGAKQIATALSATAAPALARYLPAGIGGGAAGPGPGAAGLPGGGPAAFASAPPMPVADIPFTCPNHLCGRRGTVPAGTGVTRCEHCGTGPIYLQDAGAPPPPGMVSSI